jgi:MFS family permease
LFGRFFYVFTFERFTFVSTLIALPIAGLVAAELINRFGRKALVAVFAAAVATCAFGVAWVKLNPISEATFNVDPVISFLNRDDHSKFRYLLLGFGSQFLRSQSMRTPLRSMATTTPRVCCRK